MQLFEQGKIRLNDPSLSTYPNLARRQSRYHGARLIKRITRIAADLDLGHPWSGSGHGLQHAFAETPICAVTKRNSVYAREFHLRRDRRLRKSHAVAVSRPLHGWPKSRSGGNPE